MKLKYMAAALCCSALLSACVTTQKVATVTPQDKNMSCEEINQEFSELDTVMAEARDNKGINTANVAAALLFWPAAVGNYMDADKAEELVEDRRQVLVNLSEQKGC